MTQRRFLAKGKAVAAAALVSVSVLAASPAMAGPVTAAVVGAPICIMFPWLCPVLPPILLGAPTP